MKLAEIVKKETVSALQQKTEAEKLSPAEKRLKQDVLKELREQGFIVDKKKLYVVPEKKAYKKVHEKARTEQIKKFKGFLLANKDIVLSHLRNAEDIDPSKIDLELRQVRGNTLDLMFFRWWNLAWWSIPYQRPYGRQMRYLLWDKYHDAPFGLIQLMSPTLYLAARDSYLGLTYENRDIVLNQSLLAQRIGALPPYNQLLGGKMVALALTSDEVRKDYKSKYEQTLTVLKKRRIPSELLFITTTSAFGRSSIYNRLKYRDEKAAISLGYTAGSGTFHISDGLYDRLLEFLSSCGVDTSRGYGNGPSRKMKLVSTALRLLGIRKFHYHNVQREVFLFPLVRNLQGVVQNNEAPVYIERSFDDIVKWWKERYCLPRFERKRPTFSAAEILEDLERSGLLD